ncbi:MAG TPA: hypothetical protein VLA66_07980, partial [Thermoanaerobaculia bacterium]|nr:hypothetical protein [Thermoanaerobaculia bacterium]
MRWTGSSRPVADGCPAPRVRGVVEKVRASGPDHPSRLFQPCFGSAAGGVAPRVGGLSAKVPGRPAGSLRTLPSL